MNPVVREALRYLGAREPDGRVVALVESALVALEAVEPRHVLRTLPTAVVAEAFGSEALESHLKGTEEAALLAATLGPEVDRMILRAEVDNTLYAAALHAAAAARIEAYCDEIQAALATARRPRFSPGYGDFPLAAQEKLLELTDARRRIGLFLTEGCMLAPVKSVTAVLGLGPPMPGCPEDKCARCAKADCAFRNRDF